MKNYIGLKIFFENKMRYIFEYLFKEMNQI